MLSTAFKTELTNLSTQEKLEVFEVIRSTVFAQPERAFSDLTPGQERELLRRANQAAANPGSGRTWLEVKQRILGV